MIHDFLTWWRQQLFSLLPSRIGRTHTDSGDAILVSPVVDVVSGVVEALVLSVRRHGNVSLLGRFSCDAEGLRTLAQRLTGQGQPRHLLLALPQGAVLDKTLVLPAAVESDLDQVLGYEMDVETPFSAAQVYWNWTIDRRDNVQGKITVTLVLLPRVRLARLLELLGQYGIIPDGITAPKEDGAIVLLPLVHNGNAGERPAELRLRVIWGVCLALAVLAVGLPFFRQSLEANDIEARVSAVRERAMEARTLQSRLDGTAGGGGVIMLERRRLADPLRVLAGLTEAVLDDTFITDLVLKGRKLTVSGQSSSAMRLIGILSTNALFHDPSFVSPVTRLGPENGALEIFSLTTEVRGEP